MRVFIGGLSHKGMGGTGRQQLFECEETSITAGKMHPLCWVPVSGLAFCSS